MRPSPYVSGLKLPSLHVAAVGKRAYTHALAVGMDTVRRVGSEFVILHLIPLTVVLLGERPGACSGLASAMPFWLAE